MVRIRGRFACQKFRASGFNHITTDRWIVLLQGRSAASKTATRADKVAKCMKFPPCLLEYLYRGALLMSNRVFIAHKLIDQKAMPLFGKATGGSLDKIKIFAPNEAGRSTGCLIDKYHFRTKSTHHPHPLAGVPRAHHRHEWVAFHRADDRYPGSGVARSHFDHGLASDQFAPRCGRLKNGQRNAILLRMTRA